MAKKPLWHMQFSSVLHLMSLQALVWAGLHTKLLIQKSFFSLHCSF